LIKELTAPPDYRDVNLRFLGIKHADVSIEDIERR